MENKEETKENKCKCGKEANDYHTCPYALEINNDDSKCNCCNDCTHNCCMDI